MTMSVTELRNALALAEQKEAALKAESATSTSPEATAAGVAVNEAVADSIDAVSCFFSGLWNGR